MASQPSTRTADQQTSKNWSWDRVFGLVGSIIAVVGFTASLFFGSSQASRIFYSLLIVFYAGLAFYFAVYFKKDSN